MRGSGPLGSVIYHRAVIGLRQSVQRALATDFKAFEHVRPIRAALVIFAGLALAASANDVRILLPLALGLLFAAIADRGDSLRRRVTSMAGATVAITLGTCVGGLVSANQGLHIVIGGLAGLICGIVGVAGAPSMIAGVLGLVVFTIFSGSPVDLPDWRINTALILVGAVVMVASVMAEFAGRSLLHKVPVTVGEMPTDSIWSRSKGHLHWSDQFVGHAVRLGIVIMIATALEEFLDFPHSYWIPMTVAWISRPDRDGTVEKVTSRVVGTLIGVAVAGLLLGVTEASTAESILLIGIASYVVLAFIVPNYAIAVSGITVFVFFLFHVVGYPMNGSVFERVASTLIAAALVMVALQLGRWTRGPSLVASP